MKTAIVTGSAGLIGAELYRFFSDKGYRIVGIDNELRKYFFGAEASTKWSRLSLEETLKNYSHEDCDIRDLTKLEAIFKTYSPDIEVIIHTAAQPSHDWAAQEPLTDFSVNALGTLNLLECTRKFAPKAAFIFTSTNKVC